MKRMTAKDYEIARLHAEEAARVRLTLEANMLDAPTGRCCARCKTPYNCGNKVCRCHRKATA